MLHLPHILPLLSYFLFSLLDSPSFPPPSSPSSSASSPSILPPTPSFPPSSPLFLAFLFLPLLVLPLLLSFLLLLPFLLFLFFLLPLLLLLLLLPFLLTVLSPIITLGCWGFLPLTVNWLTTGTFSLIILSLTALMCIIIIMIFFTISSGIIKVAILCFGVL